MRVVLAPGGAGGLAKFPSLALSELETDTTRMECTMSKKSKKNSSSVPAPVPAPVETPIETPIETAAVPAPVASTFRGLGLVAGIPAGCRRQAFQDLTLELNREMRLSDTQLAILWRCEHPQAPGRIDESIVSGVRRLYNAGKHTKLQMVPATPVPQFNGSGEEISGRRRRVAKAS